MDNWILQNVIVNQIVAMLYLNTRTRQINNGNQAKMVNIATCNVATSWNQEISIVLLTKTQTNTN